MLEAQRAILRDRPFQGWWPPHPTSYATAEFLEEEVPPPPEPSPWDPVLERMNDLFRGDVQDMQKTRRLMLDQIRSIVEAFVYYCRLGTEATKMDRTGTFSRIEPHMIRPSKLNQACNRTFSNLFMEGGVIRPEMPPFLMTLRQFWQLAQDLDVVSTECTLTDLGRIFTFASRQREMAGIDHILDDTPQDGADSYTFRLEKKREDDEIDSCTKLDNFLDADGLLNQIGCCDPVRAHPPTGPPSAPAGSSRSPLPSRPSRLTVGRVCRLYRRTRCTPTTGCTSSDS